MNSKLFEVVNMTGEQRDAYLARMKAVATPEDYLITEGICHAILELISLIEQKSMKIDKLRHLMFGPSTEKTPREKPAPATPAAPEAKPKRKGHGRTRAGAYTGATWVPVPHDHLKTGDSCPLCPGGRVRMQKSRALLLRITGSPPISATGYSLERLRCDTCGKVFTARTPPEAGTEKYAPSVGVTVALLRYGSGMPHYRLASLQKSMGVPLPQSTQWEVMKPLAEQARPIMEELISLAANASLIHQDDTSMRILELRRSGSATATEMDPKRTGTFTTNLQADVQSRQVPLYFTGWQHAGENLGDLLRRRDPTLEPPIQMCDALSRNMNHGFETVLAHCLAHARREFVTVADKFPAQSQHVLKSIGTVYHVDAQARDVKMDPGQRLIHHQTHSQPVMEQLKLWMNEQFDTRQAEPNSGLGHALTYMLKHWQPLTLFLRMEGAPIDNNAAERGLKMAIVHRKNSLSYKTLNGARTGDLFMSLIQTCRLNGINPFEYLMAITSNADAVKLLPQAWLPWNYPKPASKPDSS